MASNPGKLRSNLGFGVARTRRNLFRARHSAEGRQSAVPVSPTIDLQFGRLAQLARARH